MIEQAAAVTRRPLGVHRVSYTIAAGTFALLAATFTIGAYQPTQHDAAALEPAGSQTVVLREEEELYSPAQQLETAGYQDADEEVPSNYPRAVETVRFVTPDVPQSISTRAEHTVQGKLARRTHIASEDKYRGEGIASWYGSDFHGRRTANGERYDMHGISAAHRNMPLPSYARVTNLANGLSIIVRVNNRGPFVRNRIIDLSTGTAKALDFYSKGTARVRVEYVGRAPSEGSDDRMLLATLRAGTPAPAPANVIVASAKPLPAKPADANEH